MKVTKRKDDKQQHNGQLETINVFDYFNVLLKWKRFIFWNTTVIVLLVLVWTLFMSDVFKSRVTLLPPKSRGGSASNLLQLTKDFLPGSALSRLNVGQESYNYLAILQSRRAMERIVKEFNLFEAYGIDSTRMEAAVKTLEGNVAFDIEEEGIIAIEVWDTDKNRAADMANYFALVLNEVSIQLGTQEARNNREFIERRYESIQADLRATEDSMKVFQEQYGIFDLPEQVKAALVGIADIKTEAAMKEIELGVLKNSLGSGNAAVRAKQLEVDQINKKLREVKYGTPGWFEEQSAELFVPLKDLPELGTQYIRLYRDLEIQNKMLEFIVPLYEQAKIEERKDVPVVLVLDKGVPAERKDRPRRTILLFTTMILSVFLNVFFIIFVEGFRSRKVAERGQSEVWLDTFFQKVQRRYKVEA